MKTTYMKLILIVILMAAFFMISCEVKDSTGDDTTTYGLTCPSANSTGPDIGTEHSLFSGYKLVCRDEFEGNNIDSNLWKYDNNSEGNRVGWGNQEAQYYTDSTANNAYIEKSSEKRSLVIEAKAESFGGKSFTSARLHTHGTLAVQYGIIEARIKMPASESGETDVATFPAFWMLGENFNGWGHENFGGTVGWPSSGEIDIVESNYKDYGYNRVLGTIHYNNLVETTDYNNAEYMYDGGNTLISNATSEYHVYAIKWTNTTLEFYLNGYQYHSIDISEEEKSEFRTPYFLLLNLAVGGTGTGFTGGQVADTSKYPQRMYIDYVRIYQE